MEGSEEGYYEEIPAEVSSWRAPRGQIFLGAHVGASWSIATGQLGAFFLLGLLLTLIIEFVSSTGVGIIVIGPLMAGLYYSVQRAMNIGSFEVGDLFKGFSVFVPAMVAGLLISVFTIIGFILCIFPGFIVQMMYKMTYLFILDRKMDFWPAMEASRKLYFANFWSLTLLYIVEGFLMFAGILACYVGVFFTLPLTVVMTTLAYKRLVGFHETGDYEPALPQ